MPEHEHVRPLAPAAVRPVSDAGDSAEKTRRRRNHIRCLVCVTSSVLMNIVITLILAFTVFRVKNPIIKMNNMTITRLDVSMGPQILRPLINMSMKADVSIKNPNAASFKYGNTTTEVYCRGTEVGEAHGPPGKAKARRTVKMNTTLDIMADRFLSVPGLVPDLVRDVGSGMLSMTTYTRIGGKVKILGFVKKHVTVKLNCTVSVNFRRRDVQEFKCKSKVHI